MKSNFILLFLLVTLLSTTLQAQKPHFLLDPSMSPDASIIVFSYDGDLWRIPATGGEAYRLTAMEGEESLPRISPDGKWLAFSATQYGNKDVYVMPMAGGEIRQLTYHDSADDVDSWSWDSKSIYFTSSRYNRYSGYSISKEGGTPTRLFEHYFNNVHNVAEHPQTGELYFNESWESKNFTHRKRYKGDYNPDIKSYQSKTKNFKTYTTYRGKDMWVTLDQSGKLYFASDENTDEYNLYTFKNNQKTALTSFKTSIGRPQVSANGRTIVFSKDYQLFTYDVASGKSAKVNISISSNNTLYKEQDFQVKNNISYFDVSPDGKKLAFISRGELFISDIKGKFVKKMATNTKERVLEVKWLKNNTTLLYNQTAQGYSNLFTIGADGNSAEKRHTNEARNNKNIEIDPEFKTATYVSGRDELRLLNLSDFKSTTVVKDEFWALRPTSPHFSPDGNYLIYNAYRDFELDIFTYHIPSKEIINLTKTGVTEGNPIWSKDGKYIYFDSNLTEPNFPRGQADANIYRMALDKYDAPFESEKVAELFKESPKKEEKAPKEEASEKTSIEIIINEKDLMQRLERIGPSFGLQGSPYEISTKDKTYLYFVSNHDEGKMNLWRTNITPFETRKTEIVDKQNLRGEGLIVKVKDKYYALLNGSIYSMNVSSNKLTKLNIEETFRKDLNSEFNQMFFEAWANFESNFYDENFHGQNWEKLRDRYAQYLPYVTKRSQLSRLFNDMLGELNTSHFGFNSSGPEDDPFYGSRSLSIGLLFEEDNPYRVKHIIAKGPADVTGLDIEVGDILTQVNGQDVNPKMNRELYFSKPSLDKELSLEFQRNGKPININIHPISSNAQRALLYDEWVASNQAYVDSKSNNKIAYVHMKNMGTGELTNFKREMVSEAYKKDALILDLRNNTGGNVHDAVLQFLSQKPYSQWKYREGKLASQPNFGPAAKPIIILINEQSLSDAEVTSAGFKELGLGKVIGTETYRWIIFTSGAGLVDGSFYRLPSWGCYSLSGDNLEFTGVKPDIYVKENFKDRLEGKQPQIDAAIAEIMKELN